MIKDDCFYLATEELSSVDAEEPNVYVDSKGKRFLVYFPQKGAPKFLERRSITNSDTIRILKTLFAKQECTKYGVSDFDIYCDLSHILAGEVVDPESHYEDEWGIFRNELSIGVAIPEKAFRGAVDKVFKKYPEKEFSKSTLSETEQKEFDNALMHVVLENAYRIKEPPRVVLKRKYNVVDYPDSSFNDAYYGGSFKKFNPNEIVTLRAYVEEHTGGKWHLDVDYFTFVGALKFCLSSTLSGFY